MGLKALLNEQEQAEVAAVVLALRGGYSRIADIFEQAAARGDVDEEARQQVGLLRQMSMAIDLQLLFPDPTKKDRLLEAARGMVGDVFGGSPPSFAPRPSAEVVEPSSTDDEWSETIEAE